MIEQRLWDEVCAGDTLEPVDFPLSLCRLVVAAGANRDFSSIHHNEAYARSMGAPDAYANTTFLLGMWERAARAYLGPRGAIRRISGFRMGGFNAVGDTVIVSGIVMRKWLEGEVGCLELELRSERCGQITVGPGKLEATLPRGAS